MTGKETYTVERTFSETIMITKILADGRTSVPAKILRDLGLKKDESHIAWIVEHRSDGKKVYLIEPNIK